VSMCSVEKHLNAISHLGLEWYDRYIAYNMWFKQRRKGRQH